MKRYNIIIKIRLDLRGENKLQIYEKDYYIGPGETDVFNLCRPSSLLMFLQDAATAHGEIIGLTRSELIEKYNAVWVLARLRYELIKPIYNGDTVKLKTWNRGLKGVMWYRDFSLIVNGEFAGKATHAWVLADAETHRIKRPSGLEVLSPDSAISFPEYEADIGKLALPEKLSPSFEKVIRYSDLDINSHLNNTKYADLCCDAVRYEEICGKFLSHLQINYIQECCSGDCILLNQAVNSPADRFVCGTGAHDKKNIFFEAELSFSDL